MMTEEVREESVVDLLDDDVPEVPHRLAETNCRMITERLVRLASEANGKDPDKLGVEVLRVITSEYATPVSESVQEPENRDGEVRAWWHGKAKWNRERLNNLHHPGPKTKDTERERDRKRQGNIAYKTAKLSGNHSHFFLEQFLHGFLSPSLCEHPFVRALLKGKTKVFLLVPLNMSDEVMEELKEVSMHPLTSTKYDYGQLMVDFFRPYLLPRTESFEQWWNELKTTMKLGSPQASQAFDTAEVQESVVSSIMRKQDRPNITFQAPPQPHLQTALRAKSQLPMVRETSDTKELVSAGHFPVRFRTFQDQGQWQIELMYPSQEFSTLYVRRTKKELQEQTKNKQDAGKLLFLEQLRYCFRRERYFLFELDLIDHLVQHLELPNILPSMRKVILTICPGASALLVQKASTLVQSLFFEDKLNIAGELTEWTELFFSKDLKIKEIQKPKDEKDAWKNSKPTEVMQFEQLHLRLCEFLKSNKTIRADLGRMFLLGVKRYLNFLNDWGDMGAKFSDRPDYSDFAYFLTRLRMMFSSGKFPRDMSLYIRPFNHFTKYLRDELAPFWNKKLETHVLELLNKARPDENYRLSWWEKYAELSCESTATMIEINLLTEAWSMCAELQPVLAEDSIWRLGLLSGIKGRFKKMKQEPTSAEKPSTTQIPFSIDVPVELIKKELGGAWDKKFIEHIHCYFSPSSHPQFSIDFSPYVTDIGNPSKLPKKCFDDEETGPWTNKLRFSYSDWHQKLNTCLSYKISQSESFADMLHVSRFSRPCAWPSIPLKQRLSFLNTKIKQFDADIQLIFIKDSFPAKIMSKGLIPKRWFRENKVDLSFGGIKNFQQTTLMVDQENLPHLNESAETKKLYLLMALGVPLLLLQTPVVMSLMIYRSIPLRNFGLTNSRFPYLLLALAWALSLGLVIMAPIISFTMNASSEATINTLLGLFFGIFGLMIVPYCYFVRYDPLWTDIPGIHQHTRFRWTLENVASIAVILLNFCQTNALLFRGLETTSANIDLGSNYSLYYERLQQTFGITLIHVPVTFNVYQPVYWLVITFVGIYIIAFGGIILFLASSWVYAMRVRDPMWAAKAQVSRAIVYRLGQKRFLIISVAWDLLTSVAFVFIITTLLESLACIYIDDGTGKIVGHLYQDSSIVCWQGSHRYMACLSLFALIVYAPGAIFMGPFATADSRYRYFNERNDIRYSGQFTILDRIQVVVIALVTIFGADSTNKFCGVLLFLNLALVGVTEMLRKQRACCSVSSISLLRSTLFCLSAWSALSVWLKSLGRPLVVIITLGVGWLLIIVTFYFRWRSSTATKQNVQQNKAKVVGAVNQFLNLITNTELLAAEAKKEEQRRREEQKRLAAIEKQRIEEEEKKRIEEEQQEAIKEQEEERRQAAEEAEIEIDQLDERHRQEEEEEEEDDDVLEMDELTAKPKKKLRPIIRSDGKNLDVSLGTRRRDDTEPTINLYTHTIHIHHNPLSPPNSSSTQLTLLPSTFKSPVDTAETGRADCRNCSFLPYFGRKEADNDVVAFLDEDLEEEALRMKLKEQGDNEGCSVM